MRKFRITGRRITEKRYREFNKENQISRKDKQAHNYLHGAQKVQKFALKHLNLLCEHLRLTTT
jgi:hypothetical protein